MRIEQALLGMHVRRIAQPAPELLALELFSPALRGVLLIGLSAQARGLGWCEDKAGGSGPNPWLLKWKHHLVGGRIMLVEARGRRLHLQVQRRERSADLEVVLAREFGHVRLKDARGTLIAELRATGAAVDSKVQEPALDQLDMEQLFTAGQRILQGGDSAELDAERFALERAVRASLRKGQRKLLAIEGDLQRADEVPRLRRDAGLVLSHLHSLARDCAQANLLDLGSDPPQPVLLQFTPGLGPQAQAEAWFRRARRLERGITIARERAEATRASLAALQTLAERVTHTQSRAELTDYRKQAAHLGVEGRAPAQPGPARQRERQKLPYREFVSQDRPIFVGRGAHHNDRLTLDHAQPHDLWLHTRDAAGAHVVVPLARSEDCPAEVLVDAATLAAHFSRERGQERVDVLHTPRRYVRKPRKSEAGQVTLLREKVLRLRLEPERLARLLASERKPGDRARD